MKRIIMSNGSAAIVDDGDFARLSQFKWHRFDSDRTSYAFTNIGKGKSRKCVGMHQMVLGQKTPEVDHRDGDGLNNQRDNLRASTRKQNAMGRVAKASGKSSIYRGVCWMPKRKKWRAVIKTSGKQTHIGVFPNEIEAALAYNSHAISLGFFPEALNKVA